jgi:hypothetical protein
MSGSIVSVQVKKGFFFVKKKQKTSFIWVLGVETAMDQ